MKTLINTTLCYIEKDKSYLMLHRTKKEHDYNKDKWIGIGGKFENGESPEDCAVREVFEETGLVIKPEDLEYCGIVTFVDVSKVGEASPRSYWKSVKKRAAAAGRFRILHQNAHRQAMPDCTPSAGSNAARNACFSSESYTEFMHVFRAHKFSGELKTDCDEGELEWVPFAKLKELPHWQADEIFYDFLEQNHPFYSLKAVYKNNKLIETYLNGKEYNHWKI